jgi:hypothetical protein
MKIARRFAAVLAALSVCFAGASAFAVTPGSATSGVVSNAVVLTYDPADGSLSANGGGLNISALEIKSKGSNFISANATNLGGLFDVKTSAKLFKLEPSGFGSLSLGKVLPVGLNSAKVIADLDINGAILPSGNLSSGGGGGPYLYTVPEPSSLVLVGLSCLGLLGVRRK